MTLGEHIQSLRKEHGLSQEALGDALGVTRQSISKWESNGALPEVEKLIAMSKLFGVPVGVLLQVEEATTGEVPHELTERELAAVEAIVGKYLSQLPQPPKRKKWPFVLLILAVLFGAYQFSSWNSAVENRINSLQNNLTYVERNISSQVNSISAEVEAILERQNALLVSSSYDVQDIDLLGGTITFSLSATPKEFTEGMTAQFSAKAADGETIIADAVLDPVTRTFTSEVTYPHASPITLSVAFRSGDTVQTQELGKSWAASDLYPSIWWYGSWWNGSVDRSYVYRPGGHISLRIENCEIKTKNGTQSVRVEGVDFLFYVDRELVETLPMNLSTHHYSQPNVYSTACNFDLLLSPGCELLVVAEITDDLGRTWREIMDCYTLSEEKGYLDYLEYDVSILDTLP